jgi:hypothetical protein
MEVAKLEFSKLSFFIKTQRRTSYSFWQEQKVYTASDGFVHAIRHGTIMCCTRKDVIENGLGHSLSLSPSLAGCVCFTHVIFYPVLPLLSLDSSANNSMIGFVPRAPTIHP